MGVDDILFTFKPLNYNVMDSLSKLTLKGYFEQLRADMQKVSGGESKYESLKDESTHQLLELLIKAVALIEEFHQADNSYLNEDHASDYREMIEALNLHGIRYKGEASILDIDQPAPFVAPKKPMQKATRKKPGQGNSDSRKVG